jgi:hypothetical protein
VNQYIRVSIFRDVVNSVFTISNKDSVDVVHARYVAELQAAEEEKAQEEARKEAEHKAAESASNSDTKTVKPAESDANSDAKPLDAETRRLLAIAPHIGDVITDMWNASALGKGWGIVTIAIETKRKVSLGTLAREVYLAYKASKGSEEVLQQLIKTHAPHQTGPQTPQTPTPTPITTPQISPEGQIQA